MLGIGAPVVIGEKPQWGEGRMKNEERWSRAEG
jgi:hypothetical protein